MKDTLLFEISERHTKMADGGQFEVGDWVMQKKGGNARGQVYKSEGKIIYLKDKYGNESPKFHFADEFKKSTKPRYAKGGVVKKAKKIVRKTIKKAKPVAKKIVRSAKIGFNALAKKVAKAYEGKPVKSKYQKLYGKTYSKEEAKEVGDKVASKVYRQQQGK